MKKFIFIFVLVSTFLFTQNYALHFDGTKVEIPSSPSLNSIDYNITISARIHPTSFSGAHKRILSRGDCAGGSRYIFVVNPQGKLEFGVGGGNTVISNSLLNMNEWSDVVVSMTNGNAKLYINGDYEGESNIGLLHYNASGPLFIGSECETSHYDGDIDEIIIWNTGIEFSDLSTADYSESIIAHYTFNEGSGNILYDQSDNSNNGTIYNGEWFELIIEGCTSSNADNYNPDASIDDGSCLGLPESCHELFMEDTSLESGTYYIHPNNNSAYFPTYCLRYNDEAYTLVARVTRDGSNWEIADISNEGNQNNWENNTVFGDFNDIDQDYKNQAYIDVPGNSVLITYQDESEGSVILQTDNDCLDGVSLKQHFNNLSWNCAASAQLPNDCANPCEIISYETDDNYLNPNNSAYLYFHAGEPNGVEAENNDRAYLSGSSLRTSVSHPSGLGSYCGGSGCSGGAGTNNIGIDHDSSVSPSESMTYSIFVGGGEQEIILDDNGYDLFFNNGGYVEIPAHESYQIGSENFTIQLWAHMPSDEEDFTNNAYQHFFAMVDQDDDFALKAYKINNKIYFWSPEYDTSENIEAQYIEDEYVNIALVRNGGNLKIYVNGIEKVSRDGWSASYPELQPIRFGWGNEGEYSYAFQKEVSFWNRNLSTDEILYNMENSLSGSESGLIGYWPLNEGAGSTAYDYSNNNNHGVIHNGAEWLEYIEGCTDQLADNYDEAANEDDGSCEYGENYSLNFNGSSNYIEVGTPNGMSATDSHSFMIWVNYETSEDQSVAATLFGEDPALAQTNKGLHYGFRGGSEKNQMGIDFYNNNLFTNAEYPEGGWTFWAFTYNNSTLERKIYRNGMVVATDVADGPYSGDLNLVLGALSFNGNPRGEFFSGQLDNISIFNQALSNDQITSYMYNHPIGNEEGLVAYWPVHPNGSNILSDLSNNNNHGIIHGATWIENIEGCTDELADNHNPDANFDDGSCSGYPDSGNQSLYFNGPDYINHIETVKPQGNELTLSAWFKSDSSQHGRMISKVGQSDLNIFFLMLHEPGFIRFNIMNTGCNSTNHFNDNVWHNVVGTWDGQDMKIFVDGNLECQAEAATGNLNYSTVINAPLIGSRFANEENFVGLLDNVSIWEKALDESEIDYFINNEIIGNEEGLYAYWPFDENNDWGSTVHDHSGNSHHGERIGAPSHNNDCVLFEYPNNENYFLSFDGNDEILSSTIAPTGSNDRTIIFDAIAYDENFNYMASYPQNGAGAASYFGIGFNWGHDTNYPDLEGISLDINGSAITYSCNVNDGKWHTYAVVVDSNNITDIKFYQDGILLTDIARAYNWNDGVILDTQEGPLLLGGSTYSGGDYNFNGSLDNFSVWERPLSAEEINQYSNFDNMNSSDLITHYKFNAGSGNIIYDHSGNQNHGIIYGSEWIENIPGCMDELADNYNANANFDDNSCTYPDNGDHSLYFNGTGDYVDLGNSADLNSQSITVAAWVNKDFYEPNTYNAGTVFGKNGDWGDSYQYYLRVSDDWLGDGTGSTGWGISNTGSYGTYLELSGGPVEDSGWQFIAGTFDGDRTSKLYVNGELSVEGETEQSGMNTVNVSAFIGKYRPGTSGPHYFKGNADNITVWNRDLSAEEIQSLMLSHPAGDEEGLVAYYKFNANDGSILYDHSGNQNHGTIHGAEWTENVYGCMDELACNYNENADIADDSCGYAEDFGWCSCDGDLPDQCGVCDGNNECFYLPSEDLYLQNGDVFYTDNIRTSVLQQNNIGSTSIHVQNASEFNIGDEILIITMQDPNNANVVENRSGIYETHYIEYVEGNTLFIVEPLENFYHANNGSRHQVIKVPNYLNVYIEDGAVLTCHEWDGETGGVVFFRANNTTVNGVISAVGKGYRGGQRQLQDHSVAWQGESITGLGLQTHLGNNGAGGGGVGGNLNPFSAAWGGGGGGGSYGEFGEYGLQGQHGHPYAEPGQLYGDELITKLLMGSGGGGGANDDESSSCQPDPSDGSSGGGIIYISSFFLLGDGAIWSNGNNAQNATFGCGSDAGAGGGGSGGSILINTNTIAPDLDMFVAGGNGGNGTNDDAYNSNVNGGNGGNGRIRVNALGAADGMVVGTLRINEGNLIQTGQVSQVPLYFNTLIPLNGLIFSVDVNSQDNSEVTSDIDISLNIEGSDINYQTSAGNASFVLSFDEAISGEDILLGYLEFELPDMDDVINGDSYSISLINVSGSDPQYNSVNIIGYQNIELLVVTEPPVFDPMFEDIIYIIEGDSTQISFDVSDDHNMDIDIQLVEAPDYASLSCDDNYTCEFNINTNIGDDDGTVTITATTNDVIPEVREVNFIIDINHLVISEPNLNDGFDVIAGDSFDFDIIFSDPDGDDFSIESFSSECDYVTWDGSSLYGDTYTESEDCTVVFTISESGNPSYIRDFSTLININHYPVCYYLPVVSIVAEEGQFESLSFECADIDNDWLDCEIDGPDYMTNDNALSGEGVVSGVVDFEPTQSSNSGTFTITCTESTSHHQLQATQSTDINLYQTFIAGDIRQLGTDLNSDGDTEDIGEFGDGVIDAPDVVNSLKCITGLADCPNTDSNLFDAFDTAPQDQNLNSNEDDNDYYDENERGGNGIIDAADVIVSLLTASNIPGFEYINRSDIDYPYSTRPDEIDRDNDTERTNDMIVFAGDDDIYAGDYVSIPVRLDRGNVEGLTAFAIGFKLSSEDACLADIDFEFIPNYESSNSYTVSDQNAFGLLEFNLEPFSVNTSYLLGTIEFRMPLVADFDSVFNLEILRSSGTTSDFQSIGIDVDGPRRLNVIDDKLIQYGQLHDDANLISFYAISENSEVLNMLSSIDYGLQAVIGESSAGTFHPENGQWVGGLQNINPEDGYWVIMDEEDDIFYDYEQIGAPTYINWTTEAYDGYNLMAYPCLNTQSITDAIPAEFNDFIESIQTEGDAAYLLPDGWVGSIVSNGGLVPGKGYWIKFLPEIIENNQFYFNCPNDCQDVVARSSSVEQVDMPVELKYSQSSKQAFYFIAELNLENHTIEDGDWLVAFNNDHIIGARTWSGEYTDIPVMGNDSYNYSMNYISDGEIPSFKLYKNGEMIDLFGETPAFYNLGTHQITLSDINFELPEEYSLSNAYPNPFNPVTTVDFALPENSYVEIVVYDINGTRVDILTNQNYQAGMHSVVWNASSFASGIYFVQMHTQNYHATHKIMLVK